jgi:poly(A) polymerase
VNVRFGTAREDVERRDFTINGMLYDPVEDRVLDWVEGQEDIRRRRIRTIGDPAKRFQEDRLRVLRAVRFAARLGYAIEEGTYDALCLMSAGLTQISAERIGEEMAKVLCSANAGRAVRLMNDTGILRAILPEVEALVGVEQPPDFHPEGDVFEHTCLMLDAMRSPSPELALAVLLHDVGKPETFVVDDRIRFNDHDKVGAVKAAEICRRFRYSNERVERVEALVEAHMRFAMVMRMKTSTLKRLLAMPHFEEHLELHRLDCLASHRKLDNYDFLVQKMREMPAEVISPPPLITGADLIAMGYLPGPRFREMLGAVRDGQLEGDLSSREQAMEMVRRSFPLDRG